MRIFLGTIAQAVLGLVILTLIWTFAGAIVNDPNRLPRFGAALERAYALATSEDYRAHVEASLSVLVSGLLPAIAAGILLGVLAGMAGFARWVLGPLFITLGSAPLIALMSMLLLWLGLGPRLAITAVALITAFPVANTVMIAMRTRQGTAMARLPLAIMRGLRWGVVFGATAMVICEMLVTRSGVGTFIMVAGQRFDPLSAVAGTMLVFVPVILLAAILQGIEEQLTP